LSVTDLLTAIYFGRTPGGVKNTWQPILAFNPEEPLWPERDRVILAKGHACAAWYACLAQAGFFSRDDLRIYRKIDSPLEGHPVMYQAAKTQGVTGEQGIRGVDFNSGSLGHGMSVAAGMALTCRGLRPRLPGLSP
jgi:transketolase